MAKSLIRVMLSSRCVDAFPAGSKTNLTDLRKELKREIESAEVLGRKLFEVWINEDAPPAEGTQDSWDCWRRFKIEPPCRLNFEPGLQASLRGPAVDKCSA